MDILDERDSASVEVVAKFHAVTRTSDSGILDACVRITRKGYANGALGKIVGMYSTRKGPSYQVEIYYGERSWRQALKRHEFELCKPWDILQMQLEV